MADQTILIDLDALMDTRLGALSQISTEAAVAVMKNAYWERERDDFDELSGGLITKDQFKATYAARTVETLKASVMTSLLDIIGPITKELQRKQSGGVEVQAIRVVLNAAPYQLSDEEAAAFIDVIRQYVALNAQVSLIYLPMEKRTPTNIDNLCDMYVTYDYDEWFTMHHQALAENPLPMLTFMIPALLQNPEKLKPEEMIDKETGMVKDPLKAFQMLLMEYLAIEFQPSFIFSIVR